MNQRTIRSTLIASSLVVATLASGAAQAALIDRGGGLIYDTDLNVTWLQDANYGYTSGGHTPDGGFTFTQAIVWAADLSYYDSVRNVTYTDWRLPTTIDTGIEGCDFANSGTDCGWNVDPASSEMAHLYFTELGNLSFYTSTGAESGAFEGGNNPTSTLDNVGLFTNFQSSQYWSGSHQGPLTHDAWSFGTRYGSQSLSDLNEAFPALAVRDGDVAAVPEAQTYALMLAGLGLIGWRARRRG